MLSPSRHRTGLSTCQDRQISGLPPTINRHFLDQHKVCWLLLSPCFWGLQKKDEHSLARLHYVVDFKNSVPPYGFLVKFQFRFERSIIFFVASRVPLDFFSGKATRSSNCFQSIVSPRKRLSLGSRQSIHRSRFELYVVVMLGHTILLIVENSWYYWYQHMLQAMATDP